VGGGLAIPCWTGVFVCGKVLLVCGGCGEVGYILVRGLVFGARVHCN